MNETHEQLKKLLSESSNIVFLGGAGVSTESGIPDFRSENGHFEAIRQFGFPPEVLLSATFFEQNTETFFDYYRSALLITDVKPNGAHYALSRLERMGKLKAVITQNIDGLHTLAGSKNVIELHGTIYKNHCMRCGKYYNVEFMQKSKGVPHCDCGGIVKPDVVLYEESLDSRALNSATRAIYDCDMLIVGGTSLVVYPAAGLVQYYNGQKLVLMNKSETDYDRLAQLIIREPIGETLDSIVKEL